MGDGHLHQPLLQHLTQFFAEHPREEQLWTLGPALEELPRLRVWQFGPGPRTNLWVYATVGAYEACCNPQLEFLITAPHADLRHVELLFMTAWYHKQRRLGVGHTLPLGEPWLSGSACDHFLVSLPYPFGADLEICPLKDGHVHYRWLVPITRAERDFKSREGQEALEQRFEEAALEYWSIQRTSVV